MFICIKIRSS